MITLLVWRHARTEPGAPDRPDYDRRLRSTGREDAHSVGERLVQMSLVPDLILCSDSARTRETADIALECFPGMPARYDLPELYRANSADFPTLVARHGDGAFGADSHRRIMIVAHNPAVEEFVAGISRATEHIRPGVLAVVEVDAPEAASIDRSTRMKLKMFIRP